MAFDAYFMTAVLAEVRETCIGARVDKIHQPSRDTLLLQLKGQESREKLIFVANPTAPRLHLTAASPENPAEPPHVLHAAAQAPFGCQAGGGDPAPHGAGRHLYL